MDLISHSGLVGIVILAIGAACAWLIFRGVTGIKTGEASQAQTTRTSLLFWGVLALALGFVGHTIGVFNALAVMADSTSVSGRDVSNTLRISLSPVFLGLIVLSVAAAGWFYLGMAAKKGGSASA